MEIPLESFQAVWLRDVSDDSIKHLRQITAVVEYDEGDVLYAIGGPQEWLWGVEEGQIQIRLALSGSEPILGHMYYQGAWFGESELIQGSEGFIEAKAVKTTKMARIPYARFRVLADERPELWRALLLLTSQTQLLAMSAGNDLLLNKPRKRLAATLLRLSGQRANFQRSGRVEEIRASQQDLANLANVTRPRASEHLGAFQTAGLIEIKYSRIKILDPQGLERLTEE
jgi:CRP-like cAMP-binding protein